MEQGKRGAAIPVASSVFYLYLLAIGVTQRLGAYQGVYMKGTCGAAEPSISSV